MSRDRPGPSGHRARARRWRKDSTATLMRTATSASTPTPTAAAPPPDSLAEPAPVPTAGTPDTGWPAAAASFDTATRGREREVVARAPGRWRQPGSGRGGRGAQPLHAVSVRHHDEQRLLAAEEADLDVEEVGVALRLGEQGRDRAEIGGRCDQRHLDREVRSSGGRGLGVQRVLERSRDRRGEWVEDVLGDQYVAGGVAVGQRRCRRAQPRQQHARRDRYRPLHHAS